MIYHISVSGTPISWSIVAIYERSAGIASHSARAWHETTSTSQCLIQIKHGIARSIEMFWSSDDKQSPDDSTLFLSGFKDIISEEDREKLIQVLRECLINKEYLIPRKEWEMRYPASKLISDRFREFSEAYNALDREAGEELVFEDKWVMFMELPKGFIPAYKVVGQGKGYVIAPEREGYEDSTNGREWREVSDAEAACRLLNSGWNWEETQILLTPEPVEA